MTRTPSLSGTLQGAAWTALGSGDLATARALAEECLELDDAVGHLTALEIIGLASLTEGHHAEAGARLADALRGRLEIGAQRGIGWLLDGFAGLAAHRGRTTEALRLAGAADALLQVWGIPLHALRKTWHERWLGPLQQALGPETLACILAEGRALSIDEAIDLALTEGQQAMAKESPPTPGAHNKSTRLLTPRQQEVAILVAQGLTNHQIAERLVVTERAVASHIEHILDRLGMSSRTQIAVWVAEHGLLAPTTAT